MAVSTTSCLVTYAGNESTVTPYVIPFPFLASAHIIVGLQDAGETDPTILSPSDYTVTRLTDGSGGSLVTAEAVDSAVSVVIYREVPLTQPTHVPLSGPFPARSVETALDRLQMQIQQVDRAVRLDAPLTAGGGSKIVANGTVGQATTPDYRGQWFIGLDGAVGLSRGTVAGHMTDYILWLAEIHYFNEINTRLAGAAGAATVGTLVVDVAPINSAAPGGTLSGYVDNAVTVRNGSGGFAAAAFQKTGAELAVGVGQVSDTTSDFAGAYMAVYHIGDPTLNPPSWTITMHKGPSANQHRRIWFDGTAHTITLYGWTEAVNGWDDVREGPIGVHIAADGKVGVGTVTLAAADVLTVAGTVRIGSSTGPRWISGTGSPESAVAAPIGSLYSRTDGGSGTSLYVKESGTGNTGWIGK